MTNHFDLIAEIANSLGPFPLVRLEAKDRLTLAIPTALSLIGEDPPSESWRGFSICRQRLAGCISESRLHIPVSIFASVEEDHGPKSLHDELTGHEPYAQ